MKISCYLVLVFIGGTLATVQPKSVNLALETVLQFDKKNHASDLEVITRVQKFLDNVKDAMSVYDGSAPSRRSNHGSLKFTDFILKLVNIIRSYNDSDLKQVFTVLDDESRKYNYKGCKFYELLDNRSLRRFMSRNLEDAKDIPLEELRNVLDDVATGIKSERFKRNERALLNLVNSLYSGSENLFTQVLSNLNNYATRRYTLKSNLREIVSKGLKNVIFDFYSNLNPNARTTLKSAVHKYWRQYLSSKDRHSTVASTQREMQPRSNFIDLVDITRYNNNDMHKWSARAKQTKHIMTTTLSFHLDKSIMEKANLNKRDSLGLSVDLNSLKPVFQSFFKKIGFGTENKQKESDDIKPTKQNKVKTKHKHVKHSKKEPLDRFFQARPLPDSFEASKGVDGHENPKTAITSYDDYKTTTKKKRDRKSKNILKSKSEIRSEILDLNEIQKKYDKLRQLQSDLSPEEESNKENIHEKDTSGLEFLIGGQKIQDMHKKKKHKRRDHKKTLEREGEVNIVSDNQAVGEVTESKLKHKKRLKTPHKTGKKPKKHRTAHKSQTSMLNLRSANKTRRESIRSLAHASNEGMSIDSYENEHSNTPSAMPIIEGETESVTENINPQSATVSYVVSRLHKLEKELEDVKAKIKYEAPPSTEKAGVTPESPAIESTTVTVPTAEILPFWSAAKTAKKKKIKATTLKGVSWKKQSGRRDGFTEPGSKNLQDTLFESNNITYNSKYISPLQVILNQTMEKISSYLNESIKNKTKYNAKDIDFDLSDDLSKSNEQTESVTTTTVGTVSKTTQESFEKCHNKITSKEKPKKGPQSLEGDKKKLFKEKVSTGTQSLEDGEEITVSEENAKNSLEKGEKITVSKEKVVNTSPSLDERENSTVSKETQSVKETEKRTMFNEMVVKRSQYLEEGEFTTEPKEKVKKEFSAKTEKTTVKKVQPTEEGEKGPVFEEDICEGSNDKNDTNLHDNEGEPVVSKTATTTTIGKLPLSTRILNDFINKTEIEAKRNFDIIEDELPSNRSGMIPAEGDPTRKLNDLVNEDILYF